MYRNPATVIEISLYRPIYAGAQGSFVKWTPKFIWEKRKKDTPCNPTNFQDEFRETLEKIEGVRQLTPHSCRHTYVSQMQALGVDLSTIQSIVGHADVDMTQHYLHVQESIRQDAIARFSKAFTSEPTDPDKPTDRACKVLKFPKVG